MIGKMKGLVMRSTGSFYDVLGEDGTKYNCRIRGKIRLEGIKETNPIAVGDKVMVDLEHEIGTITEILPRQNHILRQSVKKTGHAHVLAANVDQAMLVVTLAYPRTSLGFIDRFLVSAESFGIPQVIVFNKKDLLDDESMKDVLALMRLYQSIGITCFSVSAKKNDLDEIKRCLLNKITLVAGHSGVGKSTLLNQISPEIQQSVGEVSEFSSKGTHTTTFAEMFLIAENSFVIDTPGVKELGLVDMNPQEISDYFPEMRELRQNCKFASKCIHINEPQCAIQEGVKVGTIALSRFESYLSMVANDDNRR
jgi:ribosome biogenesis GTPase / thiamine phosphate phosphatase